MFADKLLQIMDSVGISSHELASYSKFDKSNISRFTKGTRTPSYSGKSTDKIVDGLVSYCLDNNKTDLLRMILSCTADDDIHTVGNSLRVWLFSDDVDNDKIRTSLLEPVPFRMFGQKLSVVMKLTGITSKHLSSALHIDPSYISRFKNGQRTPDTNSPVIDKLSDILFNTVCERERLRELTELMEYKGPTDDTTHMYVAFRSWLYDLDPANDVEAITDLIDAIYSLPAETVDTSESPGITEEDLPDESKTVYYGSKGLGAAVLRLLMTAYKEHALDLLVYSDHPLTWITSDPVLSDRCISLLFNCTRQGMHITTVNDTKEYVADTFSSVRGWLPLFMSGNISSYENMRSSGERFSSSLFLLPGIAAISGSNVVGAEPAKAIYRYDTDPAVLSSYEDQHRRLCEDSVPLITIHDLISIPHFEGVNSKDMTVIINTLPFSTMPRSVLLSILDRSQITENLRNQLIEFWNVINYTLTMSLRAGSLVEQCFPIMTADEVRHGLVETDTPGFPLYYTPEEYKAHLLHIQELLRYHDNLKIFVIPRSQNRAISVTIFSEFADICRLGPRPKVFSFSNKRMRKAFIGYADMIKTRCLQGRSNIHEELTKALSTFD